MSSVEAPQKRGVVNRSQFEMSDESKNKPESDTVKTSRIYLAAITANISILAVGTCMTWSSPVLPKLRSIDTSDSPLNNPVSISEEAWISSMIAIGALMTPFIAGPLADKIGRKKVLLSSSIFFILGYIFMLFAKEVWVLLIGRLIKGFGIGFAMCVIPMYVGEISTKETRAAVCGFLSIFLALGFYYVLCIGPFVSYMVLQYFCLLVPIVFDIAFIFMPESPFYLIAKDQRSAASKSLQFLRGQSEEAVEAELVVIENMVATSKAQRGNMLDIFKTQGNRKAFFIALGLIFFQQVSGINAVIYNSQTIFQSARLEFKAAIASIIVGTVHVISSSLSPFVTNNFGRKNLLLISATFMCIALTSLGYFFYSQIVRENTTGITWLPVPALILYIISFTNGFSPVPWIVLSEMFSPNVKSIASALVVCVCWIAGFFVPALYPILAAYGTFYVFWIFAGFCAVAFFFVLFFVMETKGLSLEEIQNKLNNKSL